MAERPERRDRDGDAATRPVVSIVIPCRNEGAFIGECLRSIVESEYPLDRLDVLVVDGMSEDDSREVVRKFVERYRCVRLLDNPRKITPIAFNMGVTAARGELVMLMSAHASYAPDAIAKCVEHSVRSGADNVGGRWRIVARRDCPMARAIVEALSHRFGVGNARYRTGHGGAAESVDTAAYGCYRRDVFERVGRFNERLARGQDMEFNRRLHRAGGRTFLVPDAVITYYARADVPSFWRHTWANGVWAIVPFLYTHVMPVSWRHLVPLGFVAGLLGSALLGIWSRPFLALFVVAVCVYAVTAVAASADVAWRRRDARYLVFMPFAFAMLHVGYGLGSLWGVVRVLCAPELRGGSPASRWGRRRAT